MEFDTISAPLAPFTPPKLRKRPTSNQKQNSHTKPRFDHNQSRRDSDNRWSSDEGVVRSGGIATSTARRSAAGILADERAILVELGRVLVLVLPETVSVAFQRLLVVVD